MPKQNKGYPVTPSVPNGTREQLWPRSELPGPDLHLTLVLLGPAVIGVGPGALTFQLETRLRSLGRGHGCEGLHVQLVLQLRRDFVDVHIEPVAEELANVGVLDVMAQLLGVAASGAVDVHVDGRVPVGAPANVGAQADDGREDLCGIGAAQQGIQFLLQDIRGADVRDDERLVDPVLEILAGLLLVLGDVLGQKNGEELGGGGDLGEVPGVPVVNGQVARLLCIRYQYGFYYNMGLACQLTQGRGETASLVVARGHQDGLGVALLDKVNHRLESLVVLDDLMRLGRRVVDVTSMIDTTTLDHEEEAVVAVLGLLLERPESRPGHLSQAGVDVVQVAAVQLEGDVVVGEEAEEGEGDLLAAVESIEAAAVVGVRPAELLRGQLDHIGVIQAAAVVGSVRQEVAAATPEHQVDNASQGTVADLLQRDVVVHGTGQDVAGKARGGRIRQVSGDHQTRGVARPLGRLEHGAAGLVVGCHRDGAVVTLFATGERRGAGRAIGHEGVGGAGSAGAPEVLVERQDIVDGEPVYVLSEAPCKGERGRAHAIGDHEDEVALARRGRIEARLVLVLHPYRQDDDGGRGQQGPDEEEDLAQARRARGSLRLRLVAVGGVFPEVARASVALREERCSIRRGCL